MNRQKGSQVAQQAQQRREHGFVGLQNRGATCSLNSLLQTLLLTPEFRDKILSVGDMEPDIPRELQRLFAQMLLLNKPTVDTTDFTNTLCWAHGQEWMQQDVHELNRTLFSALENSLADTSGANIISEVYKGVVVQRVQCKKCKFEITNAEEFLDLTAAVSGHENLHSSFRCKFLNEEVLYGKDWYHCQECPGYTPGVLYARIRALPPILTICLLRHEWDRTYGRRKLNSRFEFPEDLDMSPYFEEAETQEAGGREYELFSVVIHSGTAHGGHYHAYIKDIDELGTWKSPTQPVPLDKRPPQQKGAAKSIQNDAHWFDFSDSTVHPITSKDLERQFGGTGSECAYMLFYRRKEQRPIDAKSNPFFNVPGSLIKEMLDANSNIADFCV